MHSSFETLGKYLLITMYLTKVRSRYFAPTGIAITYELLVQVSMIIGPEQSPYTAKTVCLFN